MLSKHGNIGWTEIEKMPVPERQIVSEIIVDALREQRERLERKH